MNVADIAVERARAILDAAGVKYTLTLGENGKEGAVAQPPKRGLSERYAVNVVLRAMEPGDKTYFDVPTYEEGVVLARTVSASGAQMHGKGVIRISHRRSDALRVYVERAK